ncbi:hypothetical protein [Pararhodospirillum photometricum]|uniref:hypothetical protein n=1 Tax=Pararhodospirillum photometricum TaxID=1084 RepID=UPI0005A26108|nr:hypothetical protein [Pararhodospirillum photometricum]
MSLQDPDLKALVALMADAPSVPEGWDVAITLSTPVLNALVRSSWESQPPIAPSLRWAAPPDAGPSPEVLEVEAPLPPPLLRLNASTGMVDLTFYPERRSHAPRRARRGPPPPWRRARR